jgi:hypothetical protein
VLPIFSLFTLPILSPSTSQLSFHPSVLSTGLRNQGVSREGAKTQRDPAEQGLKINKDPASWSGNADHDEHPLLPPHQHHHCGHLGAMLSWYRSSPVVISLNITWPWQMPLQAICLQSPVCPDPCSYNGTPSNETAFPKYNELRIYMFIINDCRAGGMAQAAEHLPSKGKTWSSKPNTRINK